MPELPPLYCELVAACRDARDLLRHSGGQALDETYWQLHEVLEKVDAEEKKNRHA